MPRVVVTEGAARGLERCRRFLTEREPQASRRAADAISRAFALLEQAPAMGRPSTDVPDLRELIIGFGNSGYVALYRYDSDEQIAYVLAFRHQREAGY